MAMKKSMMKPKKDYPSKEQIGKSKTDALRRKPITQDSRSNVQKIGQKLTGSFMGKATLPYKEGQVVSTRLVKPAGPNSLKFAYEKKGTTVTKVSKYKPKGSSMKKVPAKSKKY
jgi:hypothetical protein